ncbi:MAG TPA: hypothetical protein VN676_11605 [Steroidobacteraceae bacterium]|nr:hypothetical protein [Steroidobacteraceae bacterium]
MWNGGDNTVLGGLISAATLIALHYVVAFATFKVRRLEAWIEGTPRIVVHNGVSVRPPNGNGSPKVPAAPPPAGATSTRDPALLPSRGLPGSFFGGRCRKCRSGAPSFDVTVEQGLMTG